MVLRHSLGRQAQRQLRVPSYVTRRGLAAPASGSFQYQTGEAGGVKYASRDLPGPTATLALVSRAGTRYQPLPGLAEGLEKYAFRNTTKRSALRLQREAELFGATLFSYHTRESVVIGAKFFRDDLPYFVEVLNEVATETKYLDHEFTENIMDLVHRAQKKQLASTRELAHASAHGLAFHRGLGEPLSPSSSVPLSKYLSHDAIGAYSTLAYRKSNVAVVANGADESQLSKWVGQYFSGMRTQAAPGVPQMETGQAKYYGGEERIAHASGNTVCLAFPGSSSLTGGFYKPEIAVLAALLGGKSSIKWSPGFSAFGKVSSQHAGVAIDTKNLVYSDAGLLSVTIDGGNAREVADSAFEVAKIIKDVAGGKLSSENFTKARALAQFQELEQGQEIYHGLELTGSGLVNDGKPYQLDESAKKIAAVTEAQVKEAAATLLKFKASVSSVGDLFQLPYAEEMGLKV